MKNLITLSLVFVFVANVSCSKKTSPAVEPSISDSVLTVKRAVQSASGAFSLKSNQSGRRSRSLVQVADNELSPSVCDEHGWPKDNDEKWSIERFYCTVATDDGSEETIPGAFSQVYSFVCAVGSQIQFDGVEREVVGTVDQTCFGEDGAKALKEYGITTVTIIAKGAVPSDIHPEIWERSLSFHVSPNDPNYELLGEHYFTVYLKNTADEISFAAQTGVPSSNQKDAFAANLDLASGKLRFESTNQRYALIDPHCDGGGTGCGGWNRHARLLIQGTVDSNGLFSDVTSAEGAIADLSKHDEGDFVSLTTIRGAHGQGWRAHAYSGSGDLGVASNYVEYGSYCYSDDGLLDCAGNAGIELSQDSQTSFALLPSSAYDAWEWAQSANAYLGFNQVELIDIQ